MAKNAAITGLVLAGGAGRRMGGRDKGLVEWQGKPLVEWVVQRLQPQVGELWISCNRNEAYYSRHAAKLLTDLREDYQGPLAGVEAAAKELVTDFLLLAPCDAPVLPEDLAQRLWSSLAEEKAVISYAHDGERGQYLFSLLHAACLPSLTAYLDSGERTVRGWFQKHASVAVDFSDRKECFANLNQLNQLT